MIPRLLQPRKIEPRKIVPRRIGGGDGPPPFAHPNLVGRWLFNGNADDESPKNHNGTGHDVTYDEADGFTYVRMESDVSRIEVPHSTDFNFVTTEIEASTLWMRVYIPNVTTDGIFMLADKTRISTAGNLSWYMMYDNRSGASRNKALVFGFRSGSNNIFHVVQSAFSTVGWYEVCAAYSHVADDNGGAAFRMYVNRASVFELSSNVTMRVNTLPMFFGNYTTTSGGLQIPFLRVAEAQFYRGIRLPESDMVRLGNGEAPLYGT